jgi:hypothetical protein
VRRCDGSPRCCKDAIVCSTITRRWRRGEWRRQSSEVVADSGQCGKSRAQLAPPLAPSSRGQGLDRVRRMNKRTPLDGIFFRELSWAGFSAPAPPKSRLGGLYGGRVEMLLALGPETVVSQTGYSVVRTMQRLIFFVRTYNSFRPRRSCHSSRTARANPSAAALDPQSHPVLSSVAARECRRAKPVRWTTAAWASSSRPSPGAAAHGGGSSVLCCYSMVGPPVARRLLRHTRRPPRAALPAASGGIRPSAAAASTRSVGFGSTSLAHLGKVTALILLNKGPIWCYRGWWPLVSSPVA